MDNYAELITQVKQAIRDACARLPKEASRTPGFMVVSNNGIVYLHATIWGALTTGDDWTIVLPLAERRTYKTLDEMAQEIERTDTFTFTVDRVLWFLKAARFVARNHGLLPSDAMP